MENERFDWLFNVFLNYFNKWKLSIEDRGNNFSLNAQSKMFITWQTFQGFKITTNAIVKVAKFLLSEGVDFVHMERFCQDEIEEYFVNQRQLGRLSDNPDIQIYGYNDNTILFKKVYLVSCTQW